MREKSNYTLLIVDDEEEIRNLISLWLNQQGFNTVTAHNGQEAFEIIQKQKIDFVISDIKMPVWDGQRLLQEIRDHFPQTPAILLVTGHSELSESEALEKGALALLKKPFDFNHLLPLLEKSLN